MNATILNNVLLYLVIFWSLFWKGIALWRATQSKQRNWFVVILVLNSLTLGILEIIYLFRFTKKRLTFEEMKSWKKYFITRTHEKK
ncbi:MAG TPA: DUF5652 family protein [Candidatus Sulfotelmatobacter sp.]|nr:DUF5652 family protein [Candidatus Sulfotelmatobacter sp.]